MICKILVYLMAGYFVCRWLWPGYFVKDDLFVKAFRIMVWPVYLVIKLTKRGLK